MAKPQVAEHPMNAPEKNHTRFRHGAGVVALLAIVMAAGTILAPAPAAEPAKSEEKKSEEKKPEAEKTSEAEPGEYNNWLTVGVGHFFVDGDDAQFMRRRQLPSGTFGGVEDFHFEQSFDKKGLFQIDGRCIFDNHDYSLKLDVSHPDKGFIRAGYREFRTWYDGSGGFSPRSNAWVNLYNDELHVDRSEAWVEAGLTLPDWPVFTLKYSYQSRDGKKDSTSWGDYNLNLGAAGTNFRNIVPTFWDINERRHIINGDATYTVGKTDLGVGLRYDLSDNDNSRNIRRRPGETASDRFVTQKEGLDSDLLTAHAYSITRFNEKTMFTMGYAFTTLDTDVSGSCFYGASYDPIYDPVFARRQFRDEGFLDLGGGSQINQHVANLSLMVTPLENLAIVPAVRIEEQDQRGVARFTETAVGAAPALTTVEEDLVNRRTRDFIDVSESLEARYSGIKNWAFYARGEWLEGQGNLKENQRDSSAGPVDLIRDTDSDRLTQKYVVGANWYPHRTLNLSGQYYYKTRQNHYDHDVDSTTFAPPATNNLYPAFIRQNDSYTHDMNFRVTWRPLNSLTLVTRYDFQLSTIDMQGSVNSAGISLAKIQSAEMTSHILSESISWNPLARLFLQGSISYVLDQTDTPANGIGGAARDLVLYSKNNYWNANFMTGYALSDKTDLQGQYFYYRASDYHDNSLVGLPLGAGAEEHGVTASLLHRIRSNILWKLTYGFFANHDQLAGGHNDYRAHLVYSSVTYRF